MTIKITEKDGSYYTGNIVSTTNAIEQDLLNRGKAILLDRNNYDDEGYFQGLGLERTGTVDVTSSFIEMIKAINNGDVSKVTIAPGKYLVKGSSLPTITKPCIIEGSGMGVLRQALGVKYDESATQIINSENNSPTFTIASNATTIRDMRIKMGSASNPVNGSTAILVTKAGTNDTAGINNLYERLHLDGFWINADIRYGGEWHMTKCNLTAARYAGLRINDLVNFDMGDMLVDGNHFYTNRYADIQGYAAVIWESGNGLTFVNNKVNGAYGAEGIPNLKYGLIAIGKQANSIAFPDGSVSTAGHAPVIGNFSNNSIESVSHGGLVFGSYRSFRGGNIKALGNEFHVSQQYSNSGLGLIQMDSAYAGSGYVVNEVLTIVGGAGTAATCKVTAIGAGGAVLAVELVTHGVYTVMPTDGTNPPVRICQTTASGAGTGCRVFALPVANITMLLSDSSEIGNNTYVNGGNGTMVYLSNNCAVGINSHTGSLKDGTGGNPVQSVLETYGCAGPQTGKQHAVNPANRVIFVDQSYNTQTLGDYSADSGLTHSYHRSVTGLTTKQAFFTVGVAGYNGPNIKLFLSGVVGTVGGVSIELDVNVLPVNGNVLPVIVIERSKGYIAGVAATVTTSGSTQQYRSGANGLDIEVLPVIGVSPQLTPKIVISVTAVGAGVSFDGGLDINIIGPINRFAYGSLAVF